MAAFLAVIPVYGQPHRLLYVTVKVGTGQPAPDVVITNTGGPSPDFQRDTSPGPLRDFLSRTFTSVDDFYQQLDQNLARMIFTPLFQGFALGIPGERVKWSLEARLNGAGKIEMIVRPPDADALGPPFPVLPNQEFIFFTYPHTFSR